MKIHIGKIAVAWVLMISFLVPFAVSAGPNAGIKPSSIFYFFDTAVEQVSLFFTFNPERKARKALEYADERLAEAQVVAGDNNAKAVKTAITKYESSIALATEKSKDIKEQEKAEALLTTISDSTSKNQEVLMDVLSKVPDEAKEAISRAIEGNRKGHEEALQKITELKSKDEQIKQGVAELKQVNNKDSRLTKIEPIKKESNSEIPIKQFFPKIVNKQPIEPTLAPAKQDNVILPQQKQDLSENYKDLVIPIYKSHAEDIKKFVESVDLSYMNRRKNELTSRAKFIRANLTVSTSATWVESDAVKFNEMTELFAQSYELEAKDIENHLNQINDNLRFLNNYRDEYNRAISSLSSNSQVTISKTQLIEIMNHENDVARGYIYQAKTNIHNVLIKYYSAVGWWEDEHQKSAAIIKNAIYKIFGTGETAKSSYYEPMPQSDYGLTARQQLILNPIKCTITDDGLPNPLQTFVTCY